MNVHRKITLAISIAICGGYLFVGLWPFEFRPRNNLGWRPGANGTIFGWPSIIYSEGRFDLGATARSSDAGGVTIELYVRSAHKSAREVGSILTFYDGELPENLLVAQWKGDLLVRVLSRDIHGRKSPREVGVDVGLRPGAPRFIAIACSAAGTNFYVDGVLAREIPGLIVRPEVLRGRLVLGNSPRGNRRWAGKMFCAAIFNRTLAACEMARHYRLWTGRHLRQLQSETGLSALYFMDERSGAAIPDRSPSGIPLLVPEYFRVLSKTVLVVPWEDPHPYFSDIGDVLINVLGFIPFGFFYFIYRTQIRPGFPFRNAVLAVAVSGFISLTIELVQVFLPTRSSSLTDLICNVSGSAIGVLTAFLALAVFRRGVAERI